MEPTDAVLEDCLPVKAPRLEQGGGFVGTVVEHHGGPHTLALVAPHLRHIGSMHAIVLEPAVEAINAHLADLGLYLASDRIIHHRRDHGGFPSEGAGKVGGDIEFPP